MVVEGVLSVLPLLILIVLGFLLARQSWFGRDGMDFLSKLNIDVAIPVYLFFNAVRTYSDPRELLWLLYNLKYPFIIILSGMAIGLVMSVLLGIRPPRRGVFVNAVSLSNTVVMGMPVVASLFGDEVLPIAMIFYASNTILYWTLGVGLLRRDAANREKIGLAKTLKGVFLTRPLLGFLLGILWVIVGLPVPVFMHKTLAMVGGLVTPMAMIFIGSVIRYADFRGITHLRELLIVIGYRTLIVPVLTGFLISRFAVTPEMKKVFFILANMPAMAQLPIMSKEVGSDYELASMTTAATTAISMAAVPLYIFAMDYLRFLD